MTAPSFSTAEHIHSSQVNISTGAFSMSSGKISDRRSVMTYRQHFAVVWQRFVTENFDSPAHAAHVFQVDASTADKWFRGLNAPSGWVVGKAISDPHTREAALQLLTGNA
nr:hypothetical protein [Paracoccus saliphilus]